MGSCSSACFEIWWERFEGGKRKSRVGRVGESTGREGSSGLPTRLSPIPRVLHPEDEGKRYRCQLMAPCGIGPPPACTPGRRGLCYGSVGHKPLPVEDGRQTALVSRWARSVDARSYTDKRHSRRGPKTHADCLENEAETTLFRRGVWNTTSVSGQSLQQPMQYWSRSRVDTCTQGQPSQASKTENTATTK